MPWVEGAEKEIDKKKKDFELAFESAWKELVGKDPSEVARKAAISYDNELGYSVSFYGKEYHVKPKEKLVVTPQGDWANPFYAFLIVHYLNGAKDIPLSNELISFRELYGGDVYYLAFKNRCIENIRRTFESQPEKLVERGVAIGGEKADIGDYSVRIPVFPKIPITVVIWMGDEEVPTTANALFDKTAGEMLHTEDLAAIGEELARVLSAG
ncbi:MAG: DUF3786 domain-containing protein [Methanobacteriota archaeon]|nr:MAG: DUF3786 domain-containing protein [Euryarchaeota archaeon]